MAARNKQISMIDAPQKAVIFFMSVTEEASNLAKIESVGACSSHAIDRKLNAHTRGIE